MKKEKIFDITSSEMHDVINIEEYNIVLILIDCDIELLNDEQHVYKVYYSILNRELNQLYKDNNDYKEFNVRKDALKYYNELKLKLSDVSEEDIILLANS